MFFNENGFISKKLKSCKINAFAVLSEAVRIYRFILKKYEKVVTFFNKDFILL